VKTRLAAVAVFALLSAELTYDAAAFPGIPVKIERPPMVSLIAGGCGLGWHRGPWGGCRRNWGWGWGPVGRRCWFRPTPFGPQRVCRW
jgi:hypothetical protein